MGVVLRPKSYRRTFVAWVVWDPGQRRLSAGLRHERLPVSPRRGLRCMLAKVIRTARGLSIVPNVAIHVCVSWSQYA